MIYPEKLDDVQKGHSRFAECPLSGFKEFIIFGSVRFEPVSPAQVSLGWLIPVFDISLKEDFIRVGHFAFAASTESIKVERIGLSSLVNSCRKSNNWFRLELGQGHFAKQSAYGEESKGRFASL